MVKRRTTRNNRDYSDSLRHYGTVTTTSGTQDVSSTSIGIITVRPGKPTKIKIRYSSVGATHTSIQYVIRGPANAGSIVWYSPILVASSTEKIYTSTLPASTDFGLYTTASDIITVRSQGATFSTFELKMAYGPSVLP